MTDHDPAIRRAHAALRAALADAPDEAGHPGYERLEAFVDGHADAAERQIVQAHLEACTICAEDVADLNAMRTAMLSAPRVRRTAWRGPAVAAAVAAAVLLMVWMGTQPRPVETPAPVAAAPAPAPPVVQADPLTPIERALVDRVTAAGRLEIPEDVAALAGTVGTLLGSPANTSPVPIGPVATAVASTRPEFSWRPISGAEAYSVAVFDDRFREVARSPRIKATTWTPAADLPRGRSLAWQITAHLAAGDVVGPAPPQPEARFVIADAAVAAAAAEQMTRLSTRPLDLAVVLARAGLVADARRQLERALEDPATAGTARTLLSGIGTR